MQTSDLTAVLAQACPLLLCGLQLQVGGQDEQQNARETRSHAQIMRDALAKVNWQQIAEALHEE